MVDHASVPRLRPLSIVPEGNEYIVGCSATGVFVTMPDIGVRAIRMLQQGSPPAEVRSVLTAEQGEDIDMDDFLSSLTDLGFVAAPEAPPIDEPDTRRSLAPRLGRVLFGRTAWLVYTLSLIVSILILVFRPRYLPRPSDILLFDNALLSLLVFPVLATGFAAIHELSHFLAARALDVRASFSIGRRFYFLVFETNLTELWSRPRRQRYGPQLAGLATDSVVLCLALLTLLIVDGNGLPGHRLLALVVFIKVFTMGWQCFVFMRTDLYGVLLTALGCRALWRAKTLDLKRRLGRLTRDEAREYEELHPRDREVARWYTFVYAGGLLLSAAYLVFFLVPGFLRIMRWIGAGFGAGPTSWHFWQSCAGVLLVVVPNLIPLVILVRERLAIRRAAQV